MVDWNNIYSARTGWSSVSQSDKAYTEIDGIPVPTKNYEIDSANILNLSVGTTGYKGGDSGHGGRTILKLHMETGDLRVNGEQSNTVELALGGDTELATFITALEIATDVLKSQQNNLSDN